MLTKGIIEGISENKARVRIPIYNKLKDSIGATPSDELKEAPICTINNFRPNLSVGDIVFIDFENDDLALPVIIGVLYKENLTKSKGSLSLQSLSVDVDTRLSEDTQIGKILSSEIKALAGVSGNIQAQIDNRYIDELEQKAKIFFGESYARVTFDGRASENWKINTALSGINRFYIPLSDPDMTLWKAGRLDLILCDKFPTITVATGNNYTYTTGVALYSDKNLWFYTHNDIFTDLASWKKFLVNNPITIFYKKV